MKKLRKRLKLSWVGFGIFFVLVGTAQTQSSVNYRMKVDVLTGGGGSMSSVNYLLSSWVSQSSPIGMESTTGYIYAWLEAIPFSGVVDFDENKKSDVLWMHSVSGTVAIWFMDGTTISSVGVPTVALWIMDGNIISSASVQEPFPAAGRSKINLLGISL